MTSYDWNRNGQYSGQATLTDEENSARDRSYFDAIYCICSSKGLEKATKN